MNERVGKQTGWRMKAVYVFAGKYLVRILKYLHVESYLIELARSNVRTIKTQCGVHTDRHKNL